VFYAVLNVCQPVTEYPAYNRLLRMDCCWCQHRLICRARRWTSSSNFVCYFDKLECHTGHVYSRTGLTTVTDPASVMLSSWEGSSRLWERSIQRWNFVCLEEGEYLKKLSLCYSIVYHYNGAQRYEQFLQVGWLYRTLILLGLILCRSSTSLSSIFMVLYA